MKFLILIAGLLYISCSFSSCSKFSPDYNPGTWQLQESGQYPGIARAGAISFSIGNKAYVGLGHDGLKYQNDFYTYDVLTKEWLAAALFPGKGREHAVAFSINGKGYVGTGYNRDDVSQLNDFWEYDPHADSWKQLRDFRGSERSQAIAFTDGAKGYVGTGFNNAWLGDFWQYDPTGDSWTSVRTFDGANRSQAAVITIANKSYVVGGVNNARLMGDCWKFDPTALDDVKSPWTNLTPPSLDANLMDFQAAVNRFDAVTFTFNNKGYITTGSNGGYLSTTYQFDPSINHWRMMTPFRGAERIQAVAFTVDGAQTGFHSFVTGGLQATYHFNDLQEFMILPDAKSKK